MSDVKSVSDTVMEGGTGDTAEDTALDGGARDRSNLNMDLDSDMLGGEVETKGTAEVTAIDRVERIGQEPGIELMNSDIDIVKDLDKVLDGADGVVMAESDHVAEAARPMLPEDSDNEVNIGLANLNMDDSEKGGLGLSSRGLDSIGEGGGGCSYIWVIFSKYG